MRSPLPTLVVGVLFLAVGAVLLTMAVRDALEFRDGVRTTGIVREHYRGAENDRLWVTFSTANGVVTRPLPRRTDLRAVDDGDPIAVVHRSGHPQEVVAARDIEKGALLVPSGFVVVGLGLAGFSGPALYAERKRRTRDGVGS
ncbi:hypothetical protein ACFYXS_32600 [Streptomyces sp. NPDC002574]|uniref:hypothetical protein n=1 Tax=Streptomyces sp. NPDC002574 TaxID=3364652 RepID=UPI0036A2142B